MQWLKLCFWAFVFTLMGCTSATIKIGGDTGENNTSVTDADGDGFAADVDCDDGNAGVNPGEAEICGNGVDENCDREDMPCDADGDGYAPDDGDCDDVNPDVGPDVPETCDGVDNDCDGAVDENPVDGSAWHADLDGDGYGDPSASTVACDQPDGYVADATDCDDVDRVVNPGAAEVCGDGVDNDCDPANDATGSTWYADADADGFGTASVSITACDQPAGYVIGSDDCDDAVGSVNPAATETCNAVDDDCDGAVDEGFDADGDWDFDAAACSYGTDCDDAEPTVYAGAPEACNAVDDDCDGATDEDFDLDLDGYADSAACGTDCDDDDASVNPGAAEVCGDGVDNDCDPANDATGSTWYADADGDGFGDGSVTTVSCAAPPGYVTKSGDCDDASADVSPDATEMCDGADNDCDGTADDGLPTSTWYLDMDGDGYGDGATSLTDCAMPSGTVADGTDCDDGNRSVSPGATEICNSADDDCDGSTDEGFDADGDGYFSEACAYGTDCDDAEPTVYGGAAETCDGLDNDCDGSTDEIFDADGDGYASAAACAYGDDCDDTDALVSPGGYEVTIDATGVDDLCSDGDDNDCDGEADLADWDCGDDDVDADGVLDPDGILNGIDVLVATGGDTLCVVDLDVFAEPWDAFDAVLQGDAWGGFSALNASYGITLSDYADADGDGTDDTYAWCVDVGSYMSLGTGYWNWRLVSDTAADGATAAGSSCSTASTTTTWEPLDLSSFCSWTSDPYCRYYSSNDGCGTGIGYVAHTYYDALDNSISP